MKLTSKLLGASAAVALVALNTAPAYASGTTAGTSITNNVSVNYKVGGVDQTQATASDTFVVDEKISFIITETNNAATSVSPGETQAVTTFEVTNTSNTTIDIGLVATQQSGGSSAFGGTDTFDGTNTKIFVDTNNDGVFSPGDEEVTYLDQVLADQTVKVFVVTDIPITQVTGDIATVILTGTAEDGQTEGSEGAVLTSTSGADTEGVDTVLADMSGYNDVDYDGKFSARDDYSVLAALITAYKQSTVVWDPVNLDSDPKNIPGATVEYCITVSNAAGGADATDVIITDVVPSELTYLASFGVKVNGTSCADLGSIDGSISGDTVSGTIPTLTEGDTRSLIFRATIN